jgi:hypothetical protein
MIPEDYDYENDEEYKGAYKPIILLPFGIDIDDYGDDAELAYVTSEDSILIQIKLHKKIEDYTQGLIEEII